MKIRNAVSEKPKPVGGVSANRPTTVSTSSIAVLSVVAAFLSHIFSSGVVLDLSADPPRMRKNREQPRGTLLIVHPDAPAEFRDRASSEEIASLMNRAIGTWSTSERPPPATS